MAGFALPMAALLFFNLIGYYPIGRWLSPSPVAIEFGLILLVIGVWFIALALGVAYSLLSQRWFPLGSAMVFLLFGFVGSMPAGLSVDFLNRQAFAQFMHRSAMLVHAISHYAAEEGKPPATLSALVPDYLAALPDAGMAAAPKGYGYEPGAGPCSSRNSWNLAVFVPNLLTVHRLLYCPRQDYGANEMIGGWAHEEQDHF